MTTRHTGTTENTVLQERADALFDELSSALRHGSDDPANALRSLRAADRAFDALHDWMRKGNPLPQPWNRCTAQEHCPWPPDTLLETGVPLDY